MAATAQTKTTKAGTLYLDAYDKAVASFADAQRKLAETVEAGPAPWLGEVLVAQAELTRETASGVSSFYRQLLK